MVFFIAGKAHVAPGVIIDLRAGGMGWADIAARYRLSPRIFYVPARGNFAGTPYEGFYHNYRRAGYRMGDAEIINMVNLRFASEYYHKPAEEVIRLRAGGRNFRDIHEQYHPYRKVVRHRNPGIRVDDRHPGPGDHRDDGGRPGDRDRHDNWGDRP